MYPRERTTRPHEDWIQTFVAAAFTDISHNQKQLKYPLPGEWKSKLPRSHTTQHAGNIQGYSAGKGMNHKPTDQRA